MKVKVKVKVKLICALFLTTILFACKKESVETVTPSPINTASGSMYISNEGNFQAGNSDITVYNTENGQVIEDAFNTANGEPLGDVCQSMKLINGKLYIVVNNSGKIEVCDKHSLQRIHTITGLNSPRYIIEINNNKAYVSDYSSNHISIIDLNTDQVSGTISLHGWTDQMLLFNNKVYVTDNSSDNLFIIDPVTDVITDSVQISAGANSIVLDKDAQIWVLCSGDFVTSTAGALHRIDPATNQVHSYPFAQTDYASRLIINPTLDSLYYLNTSVYKMAVSATTLPSTPFINSASNNFYGIGIDPVKNRIFVSDAIDYIQRGRVYVYNSDGSAVNNFQSGIIPGEMLYIP